MRGVWPRSSRCLRSIHFQSRLRLGRYCFSSIFIPVFLFFSFLLTFWCVLCLTYRILIIFLASTGVVLSALALNDCQFLYFGQEVFSEIDLAFDDQTEGWIGIFKYEVVITNNENEETTSVDECSFYENLLNTDAPNEALLTSQLCAVIAPGLALLAIFVSTIELICCKFFGSFIATSVLFLAASLSQCGTFGIFLIDQGLCFDADGCEIGKAAYFSASAIFAFFTSCILLCCSPRPRPCMHTNTQMKFDDYAQESIPPKGIGS